HALVVADGAQGAPLMERPPGPGGVGQAGGCHQPRVAGVVPECVEHPGRPDVTPDHVALVAHAVDRVPDGRLSAGQVGVRLVVVAADDLDAAFGDQPEQVGPVL